MLPLTLSVGPAGLSRAALGSSRGVSFAELTVPSGALTLLPNAAAAAAAAAQLPLWVHPVPDSAVAATRVHVTPTRQKQFGQWLAYHAAVQSAVVELVVPTTVPPPPFFFHFLTSPFLHRVRLQL